MWQLRFLTLFGKMKILKKNLNLHIEISTQVYSSQKSTDFLLNPFCIKLLTISLSACNFAVMYVYKEIKLKPNLE